MIYNFEFDIFNPLADELHPNVPCDINSIASRARSILAGKKDDEIVKVAIEYSAIVDIHYEIFSVYVNAVNKENFCLLYDSDKSESEADAVVEACREWLRSQDNIAIESEIFEKYVLNDYLTTFEIRKNDALNFQSYEIYAVFSLVKYASCIGWRNLALHGLPATDQDKYQFMEHAYGDALLSLNLVSSAEQEKLIKTDFAVERQLAISAIHKKRKAAARLGHKKHYQVRDDIIDAYQKGLAEGKGWKNLHQAARDLAQDEGVRQKMLGAYMVEGHFLKKIYEWLREYNNSN